MYCYICKKPVTCECDKELREGLDNLMDLSCIGTHEYPRLSLLPRDCDVPETHICSPNCREKLFEKLRKHYELPNGMTASTSS